MFGAQSTYTFKMCTAQYLSDMYGKQIGVTPKTIIFIAGKWQGTNIIITGLLSTCLAETDYEIRSALEQDKNRNNFLSKKITKN